MKRDDEDRDPLFIRAGELIGELQVEMMRGINLQLVLAEDVLAAKAAAILLTRIREVNTQNEINDYSNNIYRTHRVERTRRAIHAEESEAPACGSDEDARGNVLGEVRVSDLLRDKH